MHDGTSSAASLLFGLGSTVYDIDPVSLRGAITQARNRDE
jgi:hypothetical protein